ncbi:hypothetical protein N7474_009616 [Penicillium riverlandense]|uniref:uncharacterized protein n=1 Tax=Penicillium riverlandense TaxID=1903569 RepID=UPI002546A5DC|nr:uncharacterized protein N7474_009616 [Penicillium riverlandense]KAJ5808347.1 hypothetical protein N7474_009616 [Penicillium riverlandense]
MSSHVQQYWLPGYGLSRHIVLGHIHYFLGPSASVRPYSYQGREGYLIVGMPLTRQGKKEPGRLIDIGEQEQIDDLAAMSREYEKQEAVRMTNHGNNISSSSTASNNGGGSSHRQQAEPYINEIVPVDPGRTRRRTESDSRGSR